MPRRATFVGGPRDGEVIDVGPPVYYQPILPSPRYVAPDEPVAPIIELPMHVYDLRQNLDGQYVYVYRR